MYFEFESAPFLLWSKFSGYLSRRFYTSSENSEIENEKAIHGKAVEFSSNFVVENVAHV